MQRIEFNVKDVLPQLAQVSSVVAQKNAVPILGCVKFETKEVGGNTFLKLTASDGETWVSTIANVKGDDGIVTCINAVDILKGLQNLDDANVVLEIDTEKGNVVCKYGKGFFRITCEQADGFPIHKIDKGNLNEFTLPAKSLLAYTKKVAFATNADELRPVLNSIHFDFFNDHMVIVATDGQRLAKVSDNTIQHTLDGKKSLSLPTKPSTILTNVLASTDDDVKCKFDDKVVVFSNQYFNLSTRLIEGNYPNYEMVIPKDGLHVAKINKNAIISAIKRVAPMGSTISELMTLNFGNNEILVKTENLELSKKAEETIACEYNDAEMTIGFKCSYLLQGLQSVQTDNILLHVISSDRACVIKPDVEDGWEYLCLIMPLRID